MFGWKVGVLFGVTLVVAALGGWMITAGAEEGEHEERSGLLSVLEVLASDLVPSSKAIGAALGDKAAPVVEFELDTAKDGGRRIVVWDIEYIHDGKMVECVVDAKSGKVLATEVEGDADEAEEYLSHLEGVRVSAAAAAKTLEGTVHGQVLAAELDEEDGILVWEFLILADGRLGEVMVRTDNGKIMFDSEDDGDDEDDEDDDDEHRGHEHGDHDE